MHPVHVELSAVAAFIRQHTHDIRNHLNGLELEATLLGELTTVPAELQLAARMRQQIRVLAGELRSLSGKFAGNEPRRARLSARELLLIWQEQAAALGFPSVCWTAELDKESIEVDVGAVGGVLQELATNAKKFTGIEGVSAHAGVRGAQAEFALSERKSEAVDPSDWGLHPFVAAKRGGYGLGLWHAAQTIAGNGGAISRAFSPESGLVTTLSFPIV